MVWLLGDWNKLNLVLYKIIGQIILIFVGDAGSRIREKSFVVMMNNFKVFSNFVCTRLIKQFVSGVIIIVVNGYGVRSKFVSILLRSSTVCR